jgi:hypothetical protein
MKVYQERVSFHKARCVRSERGGANGQGQRSPSNRGNKKKKREIGG